MPPLRLVVALGCLLALPASALPPGDVDPPPPPGPVFYYPSSGYVLARGAAVSIAVVNDGGYLISACSSSPALPAGLFLSSECTLFGTPSTLSAATTYTVTATGAKTQRTSVTLQVAEVAPRLSVVAPLKFLAGLYSEATLLNSGSPATSCYASTPLPSGLAVTASGGTCKLYGTATAPSTSSYGATVLAYNSAGSGSLFVLITVSDPVITASFPTSVTAFTGVAFSLIPSFAPGSGPIRSCTVTPALPAGLSLSSSCVLQGTPSGTSAAALYTFTATNVGSTASLKTTLSVQQRPPALPATTAATFVAGVAKSLTLANSGGPLTGCGASPALPAGLTVSVDPAGCKVSGTVSSGAAALAVTTVTATGPGGTGSTTLTLTLNDGPLSVSLPATVSGQVGGFLSVFSTLTGVSRGCTASPSLPAGLSLSSGCTLSGTPSVALPATLFTFTATNFGNSAVTRTTLTVVLPPPALSSPAPRLTFSSGAQVSYAFENGGGAATDCTVSPALPSGLSFLRSGTTCVLSGNAGAPSSGTFTFVASNASGPSALSLRLDVSACPQVKAGQTLVINDLSVVEDPRTRFDPAAPDAGVWSFPYLMARMAPAGTSTSAFITSWLNTWANTSAVNGFPVTQRLSIGTQLLGTWPRAADGTLDLARAPFRLMAIVVRFDQASPTRAGEGRFVFGLLDAIGNPLRGTVIVELDLPLSAKTQKQWAQQWAALSSQGFGPSYNAALQAVTQAFAAGGFSGRVNGSALSQLRTNEISFGSNWELREFHLDAATGQLAAAPLFNTPDKATFNAPAPRSGELETWISQNQAALLAGTAVVPQGFLGGAVQAVLPPWLQGTSLPEPARKAFALGTCSGCHFEETGTAFVHLDIRISGAVSAPSLFLRREMVIREHALASFLADNACGL